GLIGVSRSFAYVRPAAAQEIEGSAAVRSAIGVAHHHRGDGFKGGVQLFRDNLAVRGERGALTEIAFAGADQDGVVGMNFDPGFGERCVERVARGGGLRGVLQAIGGDYAEADEEGSAGFDEVAAGECGAEDIYFICLW